MSGIFDQVINYAPPSLLLGTVTYKGTWSAATNTPTLPNPPSSITNGNYYVVSAAGTQFSLVFNIGDWIISNGSAWEKVDNTDAVSSVFGRTGAVVGVSTDYSAVGITNTALGASNPSTVAATTITATSTIAATGAVTGSNLSGTNTGDQTITLTGGVTGSGTGSFAATVVTNANLTGVILSSGNATSIASQTGTGTKFVVDTSPTLVTPNIGVATGTSLAAALNGSLGATTPSTVAATTLTTSSTIVNSHGSFDALTFTGSSSNSIGLRIQNAYTGANNWNVFVSGGAPAAVGSFGIYDDTGGVTRMTIAKTTGSTVFSGGLNSTAIGATTPSTGAFSTLSATGVFSLNSTNFHTINSLLFCRGINGYNVLYAGTNGLEINNQADTVGIASFNTGAVAITGTLSASTSATIRTGSTSMILRDYTAGSYAAIYSANITASNTNYSLVFDGTDTFLNGVTSSRLVVSGTTVASATSTGLAVTGTGFFTGNISNTFAGNVAVGHTLQDTTTTSNSVFINFLKSSGGVIGSISRVTTTDAVVYNTTSDGRLKENLRDFTDSGRLIDSLKPRVFDWKNSDENGKNVIGFVAQEEHAADPMFAHIGAITVGDDDPTTITKQWQRSDAALIPILVAELQSLRKRLAALESK